MKIVFCLFLVLIATAYSAEVDCSTIAVSGRIGVFLGACNLEFPGIINASATTAVTDALFRVNCRPVCRTALNVYLRSSFCAEASSGSSWSSAGIGPVTDSQVRGAITGLRRICRDSTPDPTPGDRCTVKDVMVLQNAQENITNACGPVDDRTAASVCTGECKRVRENVAQAVAQCRHREGLLDRLLSPTFIIRLKGIDRACNAAEFVQDTAQKCRALPFDRIYAALEAECGIPVEGASVSVQCKVSVRASIQLINSCLHLVRATSDIGFFTTEVRNNLRRWRRAAGVRTRRIVAALSAGGEITATSTDDLPEMRDTSIIKLGVDANRRLTLDVGRKRDFADTTYAERVRISLDRVCEVSISKTEFAGDAELAYEPEDTTRTVECHALNFDPIDCVALDLGTSFTEETETPNRTDISENKSRNPARIFRTSCRFGAAKLARVIINSAVVAEESARFGLRTRAGGLTAPWVISDIPRKDRGADHHIAVCVLIDTEESVNSITPEEISGESTLESSLDESDIPANERTAAEVKLGNRRFRFRKWAYCGANQKLRVRTKCRRVNATDTEADTPTRHRCCFTFVRSGADPICQDRIYFDPSVDSSNEDTETIPLPSEEESSTGAPTPSPTPTGTPTPTPSATPTPTPTPDNSLTIAISMALLLIALVL